MDIETFRCRIGLFNLANHQKRMRKSKNRANLIWTNCLEIMLCAMLVLSVLHVHQVYTPTHTLDCPGHLLGHQVNVNVTCNVYKQIDIGTQSVILNGTFLPIVQQHLSPYTHHLLDNQGIHTYNGNYDICAACDSKIYRNRRAICCDQCDSWFHVTCIGMSAKLYKLLQANINLEYSCNLCGLPDLSDSFFSSTNDQESDENIELNQGTVNSHLNLGAGTKGIRMCAWNVQHLTTAKYEEIRTMLSTNPRPVDILGLSETFLDDKTSGLSIYNIQGYHTPIRRDRPMKKEGGLMIYVNSAIEYTRHEDLESENGEVEIVWIELQLAKAKNVLVGYIYRPPNTKANTDQLITENVENALSYATGKNLNFYLMGDLNVNLLDPNGYNHRAVSGLLEIGLSQHVNTVTRPSSSTCLDHVYANNPNDLAKIHVSNIGLSDHLPVVTVHKHNGSFASRLSHKEIKYRNFKNFDPQSFRNDVENAPWYMLENATDVEHKTDLWTRIFTDVVDRHAPLITKRVKQLQRPPWLTDEVYNTLHQRDTILESALNSSDISVWNLYKQAKSKANSAVLQAKKDFYIQSLEDNTIDPKQLWNLIKSTSSVTTSVGPRLKNDNNSSYISPKETANTFNSHFVNITDRFISDIPSEVPTFSKLKEFVQTKKDANVKFKIPEISNQFVKKQIIKLQTNKATGLDGVSVKLLKPVADIVAPYIAEICNNSIDTNTFPPQWKQARVVPLFKSGNANDVSNYRPISVLPILSKVLERHVYNAYYDYLIKNKLLLDNQSGFRKGHSCQTVLLKLTDYFLENMDKGELSGAVMIDLRKAFDLVSHDLLLKKLEIYGTEESSLCWFRSYLSQRQSIVSYDGHLSDPLTVKVGVPQGSILGPLFFIVFMNDIVLEIDNTIFEMYADDSTHTTSAKTIEILNEKLTVASEPISEWITSNHMVLNLDKTEGLLIGTRQNVLKNIDKFDVKINAQSVSKVNSHKLLGLHIDNSLSWSVHVDKLCGKLKSKLFLFGRIKYLLPLSARKAYYNSLVQPIVDYCCVVWGNCAKKELQKIHKLQKQFGRYIMDIIDARSVSTVDLFKTLDWLPVDQRICYFQAVQMYNIINENCPAYLLNHFSDLKSLDSRTRQSDQGILNLPKFTKACGQRTFKFQGSKLWNSIPKEIRDSKNLEQFKDNYMKWKKGHVYTSSFFLDV